MPTQQKLAKTTTEMLREYPIDGKLPNWYFRVRETSNNAWLAEGSDIWGRKVARAGGDPETLLAACIEDAAKIISQLERS
jgi:hypothetical protein